MRRTKLITARTLRQRRRRCFNRWGRATILCDRRRRRTAEKVLGMAFFWMSLWMRIGKIPAAKPKRNKGLIKVRFIEKL
jgi:hypothetical protein